MDKEKIRQDTIAKYKEYVNPSLARIYKISGTDKLEIKARGAKIYDHSGKKYIDCLGGYGVFNVGHRHPKVISAVREQLRSIPLTSKVFLNKPLADLSEALAQITPGNLKYSFICNSGTEAVEGALKLARVYTGKEKVISGVNAFHGKTLGSLSASGREVYKKPFEPLLKGFINVPFNDISVLEKTIDEDTAAIILEPVQGEGGVIVPDYDYIPQVRKLCTKKNILLILDEVQTGLGRTGKMFACEHFKVVPDIMTLAKALGGGIMPAGAFIATEEVWKPFLQNPLLHTSTFGGNPLACAAALATIKIIKEERLDKQAEEKGSYILEKLIELQGSYPEIIQHVRGLGLLIGIELTKEGLGGIILPEMIKRGVLIAYTLNNPKVIRLEPPLVISYNEIDEVLIALEETLEVAKKFAAEID